MAEPELLEPISIRDMTLRARVVPVLRSVRQAYGLAEHGQCQRR